MQKQSNTKEDSKPTDSTKTKDIEYFVRNRWIWLLFLFLGFCITLYAHGNYNDPGAFWIYFKIGILSAVTSCIFFPFLVSSGIAAIFDSFDNYTARIWIQENNLVGIILPILIYAFTIYFFIRIKSFKRRHLILFSIILLLLFLLSFKGCAYELVDAQKHPLFT